MTGRTHALPTRRTVLQLTPLLDLLLIVIFAQYLDVTERDQSRAVQLRVAEESAAEATRRADESETARFRSERDAAIAKQQADASLAKSKTLLRVASEMFDLPEPQRQALLDADSGLLADVPSQEARVVAARLTELMTGQPDAVQRHLTTHEELRKHADIWTIHVDADGRLLLDAGGRTETLAPLSSLGQFVPSVFAWSKRQPETKSLVLVLFSYDPYARLQMIRGLRSKLPELRDRLRADTTSRVDFAEIGTQSQP